jgi:hypothetical protein
LTRQFQKRDRLLNLLPREYLPEPEFKLFPVLAIILIAVLGFYMYRTWTGDQAVLAQIQADEKQFAQQNKDNMIKVIPVPIIQANSRYILSYLYMLPGLINLGPDWLNIYKELEANMPPGLWIDRMAFVGGNDKGVWPGIKITGISSTPQAVEKVLDLVEDLEDSNQFIGVTLRNWAWMDLPEGGSGVTFLMDMGIER